MNDEKQATLDGGETAIEDTSGDDDPETNDFGEELGEHDTKGGYNRYDVSSLLQMAVRRSDEECAAWAAWELTRSEYAWNLWDRLALYVVEDLRAGDEIVLLLHRYEQLATDYWDTSTREATYANDYFERVAQERAEARKAGREPAYDFPVGDLDPGGEFDVIFDQHTYEGIKMDRDRRYFTVHCARVGPESESAFLKLRTRGMYDAHDAAFA